jgi:hypothetical protein
MMSRLMFHTEIIVIYFASYMKYIHTVSGQNSVILYINNPVEYIVTIVLKITKLTFSGETNEVNCFSTIAICMKKTPT